MKRRVAIARAVLATGELLVLDEPFTGLDLETKGAALHYIKTHTQGRTVLLVTHDQAEAEALADTILPLSPVSSEKQSEEAPL
jgi:ABC-type nitrate/sulfonate/bicarbonate transport system ATPase subunit